MDIPTTADDSNMLQLLEYDVISSAINLVDQNTVEPLMRDHPKISQKWADKRGGLLPGVNQI